MTGTDNTSLSSVFLVRSEHLNHHGHLFGGDLMAEIDTVAYCLLRRLFGTKSLVTRAASIEFERPANVGDAITFSAQVANLGLTSVQVAVEGHIEGARICSATMTYVNIGPDGRKADITQQEG